MATTYLEFNRPTMMPAGGQAMSGESIGFDSVLQASFIASCLASGAAVVGSAPPAFVPLPTTRVKMNVFLAAGAPIYSAGVLVGVSPATFDPGDIATFLSPISAALIANGQAVSN